MLRAAGEGCAPRDRRRRPTRPSGWRGACTAPGRGVRRGAHGAGRPALEGPDQRERQGAGLLERAPGARPQRAHGLDEPAARVGGDAAVFLEDAQPATRACGAAPSSPPPSCAAHGVAVERVEARGASRLARLFSLVQLGDYVSLLPGGAVRRGPHAGGRHRGLQGQAGRRRRLSACPAPSSLVLAADDAGRAARRRRALPRGATVAS